MSDRGIYQRKDSPYWWACWQDASGKTVRRSTGIRLSVDRELAQQRRDEWAGIGKDIANDQSWDWLVAEYAMELKRRVRGSTRATYAKAVVHLRRHFGGRQLESITSADVKGFIRAMKAKDLSAAYINIAVAFSNGMYRWAMDELELPLVNPWARKSLKADEARDRYLTREEAIRLIEAAKQSKIDCLADWIIFALNTGLRSAEINGLTQDRLNMDEGVLTLRRVDQKNGRNSTIPLNAAAMDALKRQAERKRKAAVISPWVFCYGNGSRIHSLRYPFKSAVERAGLENVHPHDLRRTFASWLCQSGVSIHAVAELLRHTDVRLTQRVYGHLSTDSLREAAKVLDQPSRLRSVK